jgi:2TM family of unknown function (DUF5676)
MKEVIMSLKPFALANAAAATAAVLWTFCSLFVMSMPKMMMDMTGHMLHADMTGQAWTMTTTGFVFGLILWAVTCWLTGWLLARFYNKFAA